MKITPQANDETVLGEIGSRMAQARLAKNLTQAQLAIQAGISKRTLERMEAGAVATQLSAFIRVCRILGLMDRIDAMIPEPLPSPIDQLKLRGRRRQRASLAGKAPGAVHEDRQAPGAWTWGESS